MAVSPDLVASGLVLVGVVAAITPLRQLRRAFASRRWPRTSGTVVTSRLATVSHEGGEAPLLSHSEPRIEFAYEVGGQSYASSRLRWAPESGLRTSAWLERYPVGTAVSVVYDPQDPQVAVLEAGPTLSGYLRVLYPATLSLAGALWLLVL